MKVRVSLTLEIDAKAYAREYGLEPHEVREDVKNNIYHRVTQDFADMGLLK